ncbi:conserved hypothetical protein [Methylobacterium sp. 4-46]|uniref:DUF4286 family protein n=1 Tax=unclassified Methylobacterium TaxID=2615210 RepID=UPI000152D5F3|nr:MULTISPECIES: DUF4286 family protein [Methylobacterium]ACA15849.1 conserved hypothetical protein [Methylobacterium sp. 4-46]WFT81577.1 hypothetical protein QA634_06760 [Methylobacterium nodulans]
MPSDPAPPLPPGLLGEAALALWGGIDPAREDEFNDWYTHEHLPERVAIPGFLRARRYVEALRDPRLAGWRYFTLYEVEAAGTLRSPAYLRALETPTPRTLAALPLFRGMGRMGCAVTHTVARGTGGGLFVAELGPLPREAERLRAWLATRASPRMMALSGVLAVHLCESDEAATRAGLGVASYREVRTGTGRWLWLVEGAWIDPAAALDACLRALGPATAQGADAAMSLGMFRFLGGLVPDQLA